MSKTITVFYKNQNGDEPYTVGVTYQVEKQGSVWLISCSVNAEPSIPAPNWLNMKKFEVTTMYTNGAYRMLYNDINHSSNLDMSLFIDETYGAIMQGDKKMFV